MKPMMVFCSYSHHDSASYEALVRFLAPLRAEEWISIWDCTEISAGLKWKETIEQRLKDADIILALVSQDYITSPACIKEYLEGIQKPGKTIIPIILNECTWKDTVLGNYQALPVGGEPVASYSNRDKAWKEVYNGIREVIKVPVPLDKGWQIWGGAGIRARENTIIVNGNNPTFGYVNEFVNKSLAGGTLILEIAHTQKSTFSLNRLLKMTVNRNEQLLVPIKRDIIFGEYLTAEDGPAEYVLPDDFDGRLNFVFYNADIKELKISAFAKPKPAKA